MKNLQKGFVTPLIITIVALLIIGSAGYWYYKTSYFPPYPRDNGSVTCTMDAKQCPDGLYVGRSGPNCEFVCPPAR